MFWTYALLSFKTESQSFLKEESCMILPEAILWAAFSTANSLLKYEISSLWGEKRSRALGYLLFRIACEMYCEIAIDDVMPSLFVPVARNI